jgi:phospholipid/cholesterol/gamma-HCH transport system permease protein
VIGFVNRVGAAAIGIARDIGGITVMTFDIVRALVPPRLDGRELVRNLHKMGNRSVPIVVLTAFFTGGLPRSSPAGSCWCSRRRS